MVGACSKKIKDPLGAVEVEAKALEAGIQFAKGLLIQWRLQKFCSGCSLGNINYTILFLFSL